MDLEHTVAQVPPQRVTAAIRQAWQRLQEERLDATYANAVAKNPHYPYESAEEREAMRARRNRRQSGQ